MERLLSPELTGKGAQETTVSVSYVTIAVGGNPNCAPLCLVASRLFQVGAAVFG